ncbi:MAG: hypothetical protein LUQ31_04650 [Methanoregula sp.]|nr:hypothetical protein [Methanoregula sp.]
MSEPSAVVPAARDTLSGLLSGLFGAVLGIAVALGLAILVIPTPTYLALSNYLQIVTAFAGAGAFLLIYFRYGHQSGYLYAAGAFALWGASNCAWYLTVLNGGLAWVFPSLIDIGIIASIILFTSACGRIYQRKPFSGKIILLVLAVSLAIPVAVIITSGISNPSLMTLLYFFACGTLIITALNHTFAENPLALAGTLLFALAFMIYPLREMFFSGNHYLTIVGLFVAAGFSLIVLGLLPRGAPTPETPQKVDA